MNCAENTISKHYLKAKTFEPYISQYNYVIKEKHPSYYVRNHKKLRYNLWDEINNHLNNKIKFKR